MPDLEEVLRLPQRWDVGESLLAYSIELGRIERKLRNGSPDASLALERSKLLKEQAELQEMADRLDGEV
jgi:hypothetical protein